MDIDRRAFVKLAVGAALGVGASPLMLKFTDDAAIWTQNWPWVPDPATGEQSFANSVNPVTGTGVKLRMITNRIKGERLIKVDGNPEHPISQGGLTAEDASALQMMYYSGVRAKHPVLRDAKTGARGQVDEKRAVANLSERLKVLVEGGKADKIAIYSATKDDTTAEMLKTLALSTGMKIYYAPDASQTLAMAGKAMFGQSELGFDLNNADYVISFGTPLFEGYGDPVASRKALVAWRGEEGSGAKYVQVESRASVTASQADAWLACKPGTEGAVALGIAAAIVMDQAHDQAMAGKAAGFMEFVDLLTKEYSPEKMEALTGIPAAKLKEVAKAFASAEKPLAICGPDNAGGPGRLYDFMAVLALNLLKGNLGKEGGVVARKPLPLTPLMDTGDEAITLGDNICTLATEVLKGSQQLEALICVGTNPVFAGPQANMMKEFVDKVPLVASISSFMDETSSMADVVLPAATFLECWGDCGPGYASPVSHYGVHMPLIKAQGNGKAAGDWILALAKAMGGKAAANLDFAGMQDVLKARTQEMGKLEALAEASFWAGEAAYGGFAFKTSSGKPELKSSALADAAKKAGGLDKLGVHKKEAAFMPHFEAPAAMHMVGDKHHVLMAAIPSLRSTGGTTPLSPYMIKILYDTTLADTDQLVVEMNPATAKQLHLHQGEKVTISSKGGHINAKVQLFNGAAPGTVCVPQGLGHKAFGMYLKGKGENFQDAVQISMDALSGQPNWSLTAVRVEKAKGVAHV